MKILIVSLLVLHVAFGLEPFPVRDNFPCQVDSYSPNLFRYITYVCEEESSVEGGTKFNYCNSLNKLCRSIAVVEDGAACDDAPIVKRICARGLVCIDNVCKEPTDEIYRASTIGLFVIASALFLVWFLKYCIIENMFSLDDFIEDEEEIDQEKSSETETLL